MAGAHGPATTRIAMAASDHHDRLWTAGRDSLAAALGLCEAVAFKPYRDYEDPVTVNSDIPGRGYDF